MKGFLLNGMMGKTWIVPQKKKEESNCSGFFGFMFSLDVFWGIKEQKWK